MAGCQARRCQSGNKTRRESSASGPSTRRASCAFGQPLTRPRPLVPRRVPRKFGLSPAMPPSAPTSCRARSCMSGKRFGLECRTGRGSPFVWPAPRPAPFARESRHGFPRSHGPSKDIVTSQRVNVWLTFPCRSTAVAAAAELAQKVCGRCGAHDGEPASAPDLPSAPARFADQIRSTNPSTLCSPRSTPNRDDSGPNATFQHLHRHLPECDIAIERMCNKIRDVFLDNAICDFVLQDVSHNCRCRKNYLSECLPCVKVPDDRDLMAKLQDAGFYSNLVRLFRQIQPCDS